jgi:Sulfotransferase family
VSPPVFILGATRSGTSWLQNMLGGHPEIATPQELDLFTRYLLPWHEAWRDQRPESDELWHRHRFKGLPSVLTEDELIALGRGVAESVYAQVLARKPGATVVLEKEPRYTVYPGFLLSHFPDARFIHIIRDGRDVAASLMRAARGWGRTWAAGTAERSALIWKTNVEIGREVAAHTDRYLELRYEDLRGEHGADRLAEALAFCNVDADAALARELYARFDLDAARARGENPPSSIVWGGEVRRRFGDSPAEPEGFFGEARHGAWDQTLARYDRWSFDRAAGELLVELGYEQDRSWARTSWIFGKSASSRRAVTGGAIRSRHALGAMRAKLREPRWSVPASAGWFKGR